MRSPGCSSSRWAAAPSLPYVKVVAAALPLP
jgi:hypothetical protein